MNRFALMTVALVLMAAADPKPDDAKKEMEKMQGTWTMASLRINGEEVSKELVETGKLVIEGDKYTPSFGDTTIRCRFSSKMDAFGTARDLRLTPSGWRHSSEKS